MNDIMPGQAPAAGPLRSPQEICEDARRVNCGQCWQRPGRPCSLLPGDHLARYQRAERRGLITRDELAAVAIGLDVTAVHVIIPGYAL
jgi:hypothetical protein